MDAVLIVHLIWVGAMNSLHVARAACWVVMLLGLTPQGFAQEPNQQAPAAVAQPAPGQPAATPTPNGLPESWSKLFAWRSIGPANMSGRITGLAVFEADPSTYYVATASGGLLKTVNNG